MNQLERIRRIRQGEHLRAPVAVDFALHSDSPQVESLHSEAKRKNPGVRQIGPPAFAYLERGGPGLGRQPDYETKPRSALFSTNQLRKPDEFRNIGNRIP
jgi:hypothetical protein